MPAACTLKASGKPSFLGLRAWASRLNTDDIISALRTLEKLVTSDQIAVSGRLPKNTFDIDDTSVTTLEAIADRVDFLRVKVCLWLRSPGFTLLALRG